ncbi:MAG TPA: thiolase domain-containing protein [Candidatus Thermoplasmatota archaeon]|nr:thiolase domain-containing protein [Candidatus Thermoplasmatota archaeon]
MRDVAIVGAGLSTFGERPESAKHLFNEAVLEALGSVDRGLALKDLEEAYVGSLGFGGGQLGNLAAYMMEQAGAAGVPARRVENACASSGFALRDAYLAVASGACDVAIAGGIEKMNDLTGIHKRFWLGVSGDTEWERLAGLTFPGVYAMMASRHFHEYGTTREHLAHVAVKNHAIGAKNPKAQFRREITLEKALAGPVVAQPFTVFDCCSTTDGASAVIIASAEKARQLTDTPVWIRGSGAATDYLAVHDRKSLTRLDATVKAGRTAFGRAGLTPRDVKVAEVHDCFTIAELLAVEDLGFTEKGQGGPFTASGATSRTGQVAVNPSGGLKAKGHPLGATGTAQAVEVFLQLRGQAGARQVQGAETGLTHNVGGSGATCVVHVYSRSVSG